MEFTWTTAFIIDVHCKSLEQSQNRASHPTHTNTLHWLKTQINFLLRLLYIINKSLYYISMPLLKTRLHIYIQAKYSVTLTACGPAFSKMYPSEYWAFNLQFESALSFFSTYITVQIVEICFNINTQVKSWFTCPNTGNSMVIDGLHRLEKSHNINSLSPTPAPQWYQVKSYHINVPVSR